MMAEICPTRSARAVVAFRTEPERRRLLCFLPKIASFACANIVSGARRVLVGPSYAASSDRGLGLSEGDASSSSKLSSLLGFPRMKEEEEEKYARELDAAVRVVQMACSLCQRVQSGLVAREKGKVTSKEDNSPVTVAGLQAELFFLFLCGVC